MQDTSYPMSLISTKKIMQSNTSNLHYLEPVTCFTNVKFPLDKGTFFLQKAKCSKVSNIPPDKSTGSPALDPLEQVSGVRA